MELKNLCKQMMYKINSIRYEKELARHRVSYQDWIVELESSYAEEGHVGPGQFVSVRNPGGREADRAQDWLAHWFDRYPQALIIYGDEDVLTESGGRSAPYFKPDWSPDLFGDQFYLGSLIAVRKSWLEGCGGGLMEQFEALGQPTGAEDGDALLQYKEACQRFVRHAVELAGGYEKGKGREQILHMPRILFHNRNEECRREWLDYREAACPGGGTGACGEKDEAALLSIIIPSKDNPDMLEKCIGCIPAAAGGLSYEIIVVDNGSGPEEKAQIQDLLDRIRQGGVEGLDRLVYYYEPMEFNFSRMCNIGWNNALGQHLLFLNDDVELAEPGCLGRMLALASRPYVGAVGIKLLYPDGGLRQIQHAGIVNLPMGPVHKLQFCRDGESYYFGWNRGRRNVLAVTAACLMVGKEKFAVAGGFSEELAVAFNDVDICFRLYELGYENVCDCGSFAYHAESYSRGDDEAPEKLARLMEERGKLYRRHPGLEGRDPYYSVYLNREGLDTRIRPLYETSRNQVQYAGGAHGLLEQAGEERFRAYRRDACLMVSVESALESPNGKGNIRIIGWSVVLEDNNACYAKELILQGTDEGADYHVLGLRGQYRPDLAENMPDQTNVGLCGFMVELGEGVLPPGIYRVGVAARNRVTGMGLLNWSNRVVTVSQ